MDEKDIKRILDEYNELCRKIVLFSMHEWPDTTWVEVDNIILRRDGVIEAVLEYHDADTDETSRDTVTILLADFENFFSEENR